ncbi:hypothetical protein PIB30_074842 [Stylosanthes scabra]|uniref:Uncharacterized protein n=1 Tax=Stylosanthes scabra TaxID=79078 RepID=A0ABU6ZNF9_9FABA|nr:hypothetical protein [Stylosanthes scabra]
MYEASNQQSSLEVYQVELVLEDEALNPFCFVSYGNVEALATSGYSYLIDYIGDVVGEEGAKDMVTKSGHRTTCMSLYIEDLEKIKMRCTLFEKLVAKVVPLLEKQDFPDVVAFRDRDESTASQRMEHVQSQPHSTTDELSGGAQQNAIIEEVLNVIEKKGDRLCYPSALNELIEKKFLFKLTVSQMNVNGLDPIYNVYAISDDETLTGIYSSQGPLASQVVELCDATPKTGSEFLNFQNKNFVANSPEPTMRVKSRFRKVSQSLQPVKNIKY